MTQYLYFEGSTQEESTKIDFGNNDTNRDYYTQLQRVDLKPQSQSKMLRRFISLYNKSWLARIWWRIDNALLKPMLTHNTPSLMETMPGCNRWMLKVLTSKEQLERYHRCLKLNKN